jgi:hypothetical protein
VPADASAASATDVKAVSKTGAFIGGGQPMRPVQHLGLNCNAPC